MAGVMTLCGAQHKIIYVELGIMWSVFRSS